MLLYIVQGRKAKRKVVQEQESAQTEENAKEDLMLYKQAVTQMKEASIAPAIGQIADLFQEG